jgi:hypothetical protein
MIGGPRHTIAMHGRRSSDLPDISAHIDGCALRRLR